jgi:formamidopyrimidine-DNA glycosylase
MPELPEVETCRRGLAPHLIGQSIKQFIIRESRLRWPIDNNLIHLLPMKSIQAVARRGKYLLIQLNHGTLILHLGMSGSLRIIDSTTPINKHDHVDILLADQKCLRFRDPRRFGSLHYTTENINTHFLLKKLGPEPFDLVEADNYLYTQSRRRHCSVKIFIMNSQIITGVGNIYASEALFAAKIDPRLAANQISKARFARLTATIKIVLQKAIDLGGTTLRDFVSSEGKPGYFKNELMVYGRDQEPCLLCGNSIQQLQLGKRSTYFCNHCQK